MGREPYGERPGYGTLLVGHFGFRCVCDRGVANAADGNMELIQLLSQGEWQPVSLCERHTVNSAVYSAGHSAAYPAAHFAA